MQPKFDLIPLQRFLTEIISPEDFTKLMDNFIFDYCLIITRLQVIEEGGGFLPDERTASFLFNLKELRNALLECEEL